MARAVLVGMTNSLSGYLRRGRELMLNADEQIAFAVLSDYMDSAQASHGKAHASCPSCGRRIGRGEADRCSHARTCEELLSDVLDQI